MRLSAQADYAVVMLTAAARHCGGVGRLNATALAAETGLPLPTVQKLVSRLSAAGLIESQRGTGGGFRLARPPRAISLADVIESIEGPIALTACVEHGSGDCCVEARCQVRPHWGGVNAAVRAALAAVTLSDLANPGSLAPFVPSSDRAQSRARIEGLESLDTAPRQARRLLETNGLEESVR